MVGVDEAFTTSEGDQSKGREAIRYILKDKRRCGWPNQVSSKAGRFGGA